MVKGKSREYFHSCKRVSVNTLRYDFKMYIEPFVDDVSKFGMHSIKSGAAFNSAYRCIPGDLLDIHTGWKRPSLKSRYIKHSVDERLSASKALLLQFSCSRILLFLALLSRNLLIQCIFNVVVISGDVSCVWPVSDFLPFFP